MTSSYRNWPQDVAEIFLHLSFTIFTDLYIGIHVKRGQLILVSF